MNITINTRNNEEGINDKPVTIVSLIGGQVTVILPNGRKKHFPSGAIKSWDGELEFSTTSDEVKVTSYETPATVQQKQPAPLFEQAE